MLDYTIHKDSINKEFTSTYFSMYMNGEWGVQTGGYKPVPMYIVNMKKTLLDWQEALDCSSLLCAASQTQPITITGYPAYGGSIYPQIGYEYDCLITQGAFRPITPDSIPVNTKSVLSLQYTVGASNGPIAGLSVFTPLTGTGTTLYIGATIDILLGTILTKDVDYFFDSTTGIITLLLGRLFNPGEVYTIFSF